MRVVKHYTETEIKNLIIAKEEEKAFEVGQITVEVEELRDHSDTQVIGHKVTFLVEVEEEDE